jgi:hypothetical protein
MANYTLLNNNQIVAGPIGDWNKKYFQEQLVNLDIEYSLPDEPITENLNINSSVKLVLTFFAEYPEVNPLFEILIGPEYSFVDGYYVGAYGTQELSAEKVKENLKKLISNARWEMETSPITKTINGKIITIDTNRESRISYSTALFSADSSYSANWKFDNQFYTLNKSDLEVIVNQVINHVQACFDWESDKYTEIDSKSTVQELRTIDLIS